MAVAAILLAPVVLAAPAAAAEAPPVVFETKLVHPEGDIRGYGSAVALSGDTLVIGTRAGVLSLPGGAFVYARAPGGWALEARLVVAETNTAGHSVAIDGDTIVLGSMRTADNGADSGAAFVFERSGTSWTQQAKLLPGDGHAGAFFGAAVAISGSRVVVGAPDANGAVSSSGAAYVFQRAGSSWSQAAKLSPADAGTNDDFGKSVDIEGEIVAVGAPLQASHLGATYVFSYSGGAWLQEAKLSGQPRPEGGSVFAGHGVSLAPSTLIYSEASGARIYSKINGTWVRAAALLGSGSFVWSVAMDDGVALVGRFGEASVGSAYVFARDESGWTQRARLVAFDGQTHDQFGFALAVDGGRAVIGADGDDDVGTDAGSAYTFIADTTPPAFDAVRDVVAEAAGPDGAVVAFETPTANDDVDGARPVTCAPASGTLFPLGQTQVTCRASDLSGNVQTAAFNVTVRDTTPPTISQPPDITLFAADLEGAVVSFEPPAAHDAVGAVTVGCAPASGVRFAIGDTRVGCTAEDASGNVALANFTVSVLPPISGSRAPMGVGQDLVAADAMPGDHFGYRVAMTLDTLVVNSPRYGAYVYRLETGSWQMDAKLELGTGATAVAVGGSTILIGSPDEPVDGRHAAGAVHAFVRNGTTWEHQARIVASDPREGASFGAAVAISGDTIVVGSPNADGAAAGSGAVYVLQRDGATWTQQARLAPAQGTIYSDFGGSVGISGHRIVVGDTWSSNTAAVFARSGGAWSHEATLVDPLTTGYFGHSTAISRDTILLSTPLGAQVFVLNGTNWSHQATLAAAAEMRTSFGPSVAIDGNIALVGSHLQSGYGGAALYVRDGGVWEHRANLTASDGAEGDNFGYAVAVAGERASIGAYSDDHVVVDGGSVRTFQPDETAPVFAPTPDIVAEARSSAGAAVAYPLPSATDETDGPVTVRCEPASGGVFPLGETRVLCHASDRAGNAAEASFSVLVRDTTPPEFEVVSTLETPARDSSGTVVEYPPVTWLDAVDGEGVAACAPASGSIFPTGRTDVTCTASDAAGNAASMSFAIVVVATAPPAPEGLAASSGLHNVTLEWRAPAVDGGEAIGGFVILRNGTVIADVGAAVRSFTDEGRPSGVASLYEVAARNAVGEGGRANVTAAALAPPSAPRNLTAEAAPLAGVALAWDAPADTAGLSVSSYRVYRANATGAEPAWIATVQDRTYVDEGCRAPDVCTYVVTAVTAAGEGDASARAHTVALQVLPRRAAAETFCAVYGSDDDADGRTDRIVLRWCTATIQRDGSLQHDGEREESVAAPRP